MKESTRGCFISIAVVSKIAESYYIKDMGEVLVESIAVHDHERLVNLEGNLEMIMIGVLVQTMKARIGSSVDIG